MSLIKCEDFIFWLVAVSAGVGSSGTSSFYVIPHPIFWLTVPYGLLLCFASALFPSSIPDYLPLGPLARYDHYPFCLSLNSEKYCFYLILSYYSIKLLTFNRCYQTPLRQSGRDPNPVHHFHPLLPMIVYVAWLFIYSYVPL